MFFLRDFSQENLVERCEIAVNRSLHRNRPRSRKFFAPCRVNILCAALAGISLASLPAAALNRQNHGILSLSTTSLAFGNVQLNTPATLVLTLTSSGSNMLNLPSAAISGSGFSFSGAAFPLSLPSGASVTLVVQFDPTAAGAATGSLVLVSGFERTLIGESERTTTIALSGTGVSSSPSSSSSPSTPTLSVNSGAIAFGDVIVNSASTQSLTLNSTGTTAVTVSGAAVTGAGFSLSGASFPLTLAPNQSAVLSVQFDPTTPGAATGVLSLASNSSTGATTTISLTGTGAATSSGDPGVNLSWSAPASSPDPVAGYDVFRASNGTTSYRQLNASPVTQTAYTDATVQSGQAYQYYVESVDASGNTSVPSTGVSITAQ